MKPSHLTLAWIILHESYQFGSVLPYKLILLKNTLNFVLQNTYITIEIEIFPTLKWDKARIQ